MSNLLEYAKRELDRIPKDADGMQEMINKDILHAINKNERGMLSAGLAFTSGMVMVSTASKLLLYFQSRGIADFRQGMRLVR